MDEAKLYALRVKRAYDAPEPSDGLRYLVDRIWPRGIKKEALQINAWLKDLAPSSVLRIWFNHEPAKWDEFCRLYSAELECKPEMWQSLLNKLFTSNVTLIYSARSESYNNAVALRNYLMEKMK